jgi:hypothetical protein
MKYVALIFFFLAPSFSVGANSFGVPGRAGQAECDTQLARCLQSAFEQALSNDQACIKTWCDKVFFLTFCDEEGLSRCIQKADAVYGAALRACQTDFSACSGMERRNS